MKSVECLYGKQSIEYLYEYGTQFLRKYNSNRKFLSFVSNEGHEGSLEALKFLDDIIYNY